MRQNNYSHIHFIHQHQVVPGSYTGERIVTQLVCHSSHHHLQHSGPKGNKHSLFLACTHFLSRARGRGDGEVEVEYQPSSPSPSTKATPLFTLMTLVQSTTQSYTSPFHFDNVSPTLLSSFIFLYLLNDLILPKFIKQREKTETNKQTNDHFLHQHRI